MSLLTPKRVQFDDRMDRARFLLVWRLSLVFTLIFAILTYLFYFDANDTFISYLGAFTISFLSLLFLLKFKKYKVVFFLYAISGTVIINASMILILDAPHFVDFLWILLGILMAFFGLGVRWGLVFMFINLVPSIYFLMFHMNEHLSIIQQQTYEERILISIEVGSCMLLISYIIYQFVKITKKAQVDLIERNKALEERNEIIEQSNEENIVLVKEIHHRVKNNLQIIISLLRLQMSDVKSAEAKEHFSEAINRVLVMSSIHQKLYRQEDIARFNLQTYIEELAQELKQFFAEEQDISIDIDTNYTDKDLKIIIPLGLILNELLSNSFKYAFKDRPSGAIRIQIEDMDTYFIMKYSDNGAWKEKSDDTQGGFGLELIETLTEQLNGLIRTEKGQMGTTFTFEMQKLND